MMEPEMPFDGPAMPPSRNSPGRKRTLSAPEQALRNRWRIFWICAVLAAFAVLGVANAPAPEPPADDPVSRCLRTMAYTEWYFNARGTDNVGYCRRAYGTTQTR
jgi:hypothetical protein